MSKDEEMQRVIAEVIARLKKQGITVEATSILNLGDNKPGKEDAINKAVNSIYDSMAKSSFPFNKPTGENTPTPTGLAPENREQCFCPGCFNFNNFEAVLANRKGVFDYMDLPISGKLFHLKAFIGEDDQNHFTIEQSRITVDTTGMTLEQLEAGLSAAVQNKEYDNAQHFMDEINYIKNQNQ